MKNIPEGAQEQILGLTGVWVTVEAHAAFLHSGKMKPLLMELLPFITMRDVLHLQVAVLSAAQKELLQRAMICAAFHVKPPDREAMFRVIYLAIGHCTYQIYRD